MADPLNQIPPPSSWVPSRSVVGGAGIGLAAGQIVIAICDRAFHAPLGPELSSAITTLCIAAATYFIPDRK